MKIIVYIFVIVLFPLKTSHVYIQTEISESTVFLVVHICNSYWHFVNNKSKHKAEIKKLKKDHFYMQLVSNIQVYTPEAKP